MIIDELAMQLKDDQIAQLQEMLKEKDQTIKNLSYQLAAEKEKTLFVKDVAMGLVRNTEYRKTVFPETLHKEGCEKTTVL